VANFENTVMIRRPIEEVFGFLSDFENVPKWNYAIVETHKVSQGPVGVGTIYQQVRSVPSPAKSASRSPPTTRPASWRYEAYSGRSPRVSPMPWTPFPREPCSQTR
jgi:hypothetical protein